MEIHLDPRTIWNHTRKDLSSWKAEPSPPLAKHFPLSKTPPAPIFRPPTPPRWAYDLPSLWPTPQGTCPKVEAGWRSGRLGHVSSPVPLPVIRTRSEPLKPSNRSQRPSPGPGSYFLDLRAAQTLSQNPDDGALLKVVHTDRSSHTHKFAFRSTQQSRTQTLRAQRTPVELSHSPWSRLLRPWSSPSTQRNPTHPNRVPRQS